MFCILCIGYHLSQDVAPVDIHFKLLVEEERRTLGEQHSLHEDFEVFQHGRDLRVDFQVQHQRFFVVAEMQVGVFHGVVDTVVDVESHKVCVAHTAAANVGLVGDDEGGGNGIHRLCRALVVVADGGDDGTDLIHRHLQPVQQTKRHDGAALGVVGAVDDVADVMEKSGDLAFLYREKDDGNLGRS